MGRIGHILNQRLLALYPLGQEPMLYPWRIPLTAIGDEQNSSLAQLMRSARLRIPLLALVIGLLAAWAAGATGHFFPSWLHLTAWLLIILGLAVTLNRLHRYLFRPLITMQNALYHFNQGEPGVRVGDGRVGVLDGMAKDINSLIEELADLYDDMDNRVARQTRRLAQNTASLHILYDVANSINEANSLDELLTRFLRVLKEMVGALTATVQLAMPDGRLRIVACLGQDGQVRREREILPIQLCRCGVALTPGDILCGHDPEHCSLTQGRRMYGPEDIEVVDVPLRYHEETLGLYRLYAPKSVTVEREELMEMLATVGRHLGMAVAKQRSDEEARRLSIIEERTTLAHELHDSLAQTLASLRFQVRMLSETLEEEGASEQASQESRRIVSSVDEAHTELRELLNSFRAPLDQRGLLPALLHMIERFREETGTPVFLQVECRFPPLSGNEEMQLLRIVQESLANIRKHAKAHTVRVLLRCASPRGYILLVEDDGVGFEHAARLGKPGEHIGLSILEERARRLNGSIRIESEPGEGTRVELVFQPSGRSGRAMIGGRAEPRQ